MCQYDTRKQAGNKRELVNTRSRTIRGLRHIPGSLVIRAELTPCLPDTIINARFAVSLYL